MKTTIKLTAEAGSLAGREVEITAKASGDRDIFIIGNIAGIGVVKVSFARLPGIIDRDAIFNDLSFSQYDNGARSAIAEIIRKTDPAKADRLMANAGKTVIKVKTSKEQDAAITAFAVAAYEALYGPDRRHIDTPEERAAIEREVAIMEHGMEAYNDFHFNRD